MDIDVLNTDTDLDILLTSLDAGGFGRQYFHGPYIGMTVGFV